MGTDGIVHRSLNRVPGRGLQTDIQLRMERLEFAPDFLLGLARDLPAQPPTVRPEADRDRADVPVLVCREVDGILTMPTPSDLVSLEHPPGRKRPPRRRRPAPENPQRRRKTLAGLAAEPP
jgi:hypothetical protein